jgi:7-cyano-7-deazaguanine synthase in queuosine biosynthesis
MTPIATPRGRDGEASACVERLVVRPRVQGSVLAFPYTTDQGDSGAITARYPHALSADDEATVPAIALGVATYLGQLCLAREIAVECAGSGDMAEAMTPIAEMLYDVRRWMDELPLSEPPAYRFAGRGRCDARAHRAEGERALLMWSGGKDSTLAGVTLKRNGYRVQALHAYANAGVEAEERAAVDALSAALDQSVVHVHVQHPEFLALSNRYAVHWDSFPYSNRVPFGRDLLLAVLAAPVLRSEGAAHLSMGHDNECRNATVDYLGKRIPRNDIESASGAIALERYFREFLLPDVSFLPPLANLSEYRILHEMLTRHPDLMARTAFCFWGGNCGRCGKCLRYYLAQRVVGREVLRFAANPLAAGSCPELDDLIAASGPRSTLFQKEVVWCLGQLAARGDIRPEEDRLRDFAQSLYPRVAGELDLWEHELMAPRPDPQVPDGFQPL